MSGTQMSTWLKLDWRCKFYSRLKEKSTKRSSGWKQKIGFVLKGKLLCPQWIWWSDAHWKYSKLDVTLNKIDLLDFSRFFLVLIPYKLELGNQLWSVGFKLVLTNKLACSDHFFFLVTNKLVHWSVESSFLVSKR